MLNNMKIGARLFFGFFLAEMMVSAVAIYAIVNIGPGQSRGVPNPPKCSP